MPELPEVETIRRGLEENIVGKKITDLTISLPKIVRGSLQNFKDQLIGTSFSSVERRGKLLIFAVADSPSSMLLHLKMTGQLIYPAHQANQTITGGHPFPDFNQSVPNKFTHLQFHFADHTTLYYNDLRQFGYAELVDPATKKMRLSKFGLEPLTNSFTFPLWLQLVKNKKTMLKSFLLNQQYVAGIGNIYADEIAFASGLHPIRPLDTLSEADHQLLFQATKQILTNAVSKRGTTFRNYADNEGKKGGYAPYLKVYGREGQTCLRCGGTIIKEKVAGRGTHFCPDCQK